MPTDGNLKVKVHSDDSERSLTSGHFQIVQVNPAERPPPPEDLLAVPPNSGDGDVPTTPSENNERRPTKQYRKPERKQ
eukprot:965866-Pleurochrysis_carterae.AAC.1